MAKFERCQRCGRQRRSPRHKCQFSKPLEVRVEWADEPLDVPRLARTLILGIIEAEGDEEMKRAFGLL